MNTVQKSAAVILFNRKLQANCAHIPTFFFFLFFFFFLGRENLEEGCEPKVDLKGSVRILVTILSTARNRAGKCIAMSQTKNISMLTVLKWKLFLLLHFTDYFFFSNIYSIVSIFTVWQLVPYLEKSIIESRTKGKLLIWSRSPPVSYLWFKKMM